MNFKDEEYIKVLKALSEIPFDVGKNLLADFLRGDYKNKSISKNCLDELETFGISSWSKDFICDVVDALIREGMIEAVVSDYNRFVKVLRITLKGKSEILNPTLLDKGERQISLRRSEVTDLDRRKFSELSSYLEGFNPDQKKAIVSDAQEVLCIAGAGSGKTTTLTKRIEFLVKYQGVSPKDILAITFTRKAREEMDSRLSELGVIGVNVHTFNSFCERILRSNEREIYGMPMRVQGYGDKVLAMNMALGSIGLTMNEMIDKYFSPQQKRFKSGSQLANGFMNDCFSLLEYFKMSGGGLSDFSGFVDEKERDNARTIYQVLLYLEEHMRMQGLRDYADQLLDTVNFFKKNELAIPAFRHILVDEYQDVNNSQIELLCLLNPNNFFCVGDPRQSIFGWRGSDINHILEFEKQYPLAEIIHLTKNYRSDAHIVNFMNRSIKDMGLPDLEGHKSGSGRIKVLDFENELAEMTFIISQIVESQSDLGEIFVLARTNRQLQELALMMSQRKIPFVLKTDDGKSSSSDSNGSVILATVHAIKGLEAKKVFVMGCNEQNFPCKASDHPIVELVKMNHYDRLDEEKRLFYVALSRAKEELYLTYTGKKPTYFLTDEMISLVNASQEQLV